ncbi:MAG: MarP family serine protease [Candidatus Dormibacteria bacterium]
MDYVDLAIIGLMFMLAVSGYCHGLSWVAFSVAGLAAGLLLGAVLSSRVALAISHDYRTASLVALAVFLLIVIVVHEIGVVIGARIRAATLRTAFARWDSGLGALMAVISTLVGAWCLGVTLSQSPWLGLDHQIQRSAIERVLDGVVPPPPGFLAALENVLGGSNGPNPFSALVPDFVIPLRIPSTINTPATRAAAAGTEKVVAFGCGEVAGSSWPEADGYMVTAAHVVAGSVRVEVDTQAGVAHLATVVFFDPRVDVAILYVPSLVLTPLRALESDPSRGTSAVVIGYPGGGHESVVSAVVRGTERVTGHNIYGDGLGTRDIAVLSALVIPGDSGGPIVNTDGVVIGLVFAASTTSSDEGYALTVSEIAPDLRAAAGKTQPVSTQGCVK